MTAGSYTHVMLSVTLCCSKNFHSSNFFNENTVKSYNFVEIL